MIDALASGQRLAGGIQVADIAVHALHLEIFQALVVVLVPQQHAYPDPFIDQPVHEIGTHVPGRAGNENGWR